jgi:hypothetical protein
MWMEVLMVYLRVLSGNLPGGTKENLANICQNSRCPGQESNWIPSDCKAQMLPFETTCWVEKYRLRKWERLINICYVSSVSVVQQFTVMQQHLAFPVAHSSSLFVTTTEISSWQLLNVTVQRVEHQLSTAGLISSRQPLFSFFLHFPLPILLLGPPGWLSFSFSN